MNTWKEHIAQLDELLKTLKEQLLPYWSPEHKKEKLAQLKSVEKSINQLQKGNTPIPDELRDLKFRLLSELDLFREAELIKAEVLRLMEPFNPKLKAIPNKKRVEVSPKQPKSTQGESRITLAQLIESGLLPAPLKIFRKFKGEEFLATINNKGQIEMVINHRTEFFTSPSSAAMAATGKPKNGWTWWFTDFEGEVRELDFYRNKHVKT